MKRGLRPRIIRFRRCSKGVSTVIGTIFLVLIALTVATNVFLWTFTQNANYNQAVKESLQMEADIASERIVAYNTLYSDSESSDAVEVTTTMAAQGALSAKIITVWVTVDGSDKYGNTTVEFNLTPGDTPKTETITVTMSGTIDVNDKFNGWLITARGNRVPLEEKRVEEIIVSDVSLGIGAISMNFSNFRYYNVTDDKVLENYTTSGGEGYDVIQGADGIAFQVALTNFDIHNRAITLYSPSVFFTIIPSTSTQVHAGMWYIVNVNASGIIADDFTNITVNHGSTVNLFFASQQNMNEGGFLASRSKYRGIAPANLALFGKIGTQSYGQNIPFVSIYVQNGL